MAFVVYENFSSNVSHHYACSQYCQGNQNGKIFMIDFTDLNDQVDQMPENLQ